MLNVYLLHRAIFNTDSFKMRYYLLCTMPSVSWRGDMDLENHRVVIPKIGSHSVELTVSRKENWLVWYNIW